MRLPVAILLLATLACSPSPKQAPRTFNDTPCNDEYQVNYNPYTRMVYTTTPLYIGVCGGPPIFTSTSLKLHPTNFVYAVRIEGEPGEHEVVVRYPHSTKSVSITIGIPSPIEGVGSEVQ